MNFLVARVFRVEFPNPINNPSPPVPRGILDEKLPFIFYSWNLKYSVIWLGFAWSKGYQVSQLTGVPLNAVPWKCKKNRIETIFSSTDWLLQLQKFIWRETVYVARKYYWSLVMLMIEINFFFKHYRASL